MVYECYVECGSKVGGRPRKRCIRCESCSRGGYTNIDRASTCYSEISSSTPFQLRVSASTNGPFSDSTLPIPAIPNFNRSISARCCHIPSTFAGVNGNTNYWAHVGQQLNGRVGQIRRPKGYATVLMTQVDNGVV